MTEVCLPDELAPRILSMAIEYSLPFLQNSAVNYITKFLGSVVGTGDQTLSCIQGFQFSNGYLYIAP